MPHGGGHYGMSRRRRLLIWVIAVILLLLGQLVWMFALRGPRILDSDGVLVAGQALLALPVLVIALLLKTTPADAIKLRRGTSEAVILGGCALLQLAAVALLRPALSEDVLRYRVDGRMWLDGVSPHATPPSEWANADAIDAMVPFPRMRTIYPAVSQATFALGAAVERELGHPFQHVPPTSWTEHSPWRRHLSTRAPYRATVFRSIYASAAVLSAGVLLLTLHAIGQSAWWAVIFAWNPLLTLEAGGMGHQDIVGVLLLLAAVYALLRQRAVVSATFLALAAAVKPFAFLIVPFACRDLERRRRRGRAACAFAFVLALLYLPPLLIQRGHAGWRETATTYSQTWEANGSLYEFIVRTFGDGDEGRANERAKQMSRLLAAAAMVATFLAAWRYGASAATAGYWLCLVAPLVAPVAYPWYLLWALCFVPLLGGAWGWTAIAWAGTASLSYTMWHQPAWRMSSGALMLEYGVVYAALALELVRAARVARAAAMTQPTPAMPPPAAATSG